MTKFYAKEIYDFVLTILAILRQFSSRIILFYCIFFCSLFKWVCNGVITFDFEKTNEHPLLLIKHFIKFMSIKNTLYIFFMGFFQVLSIGGEGEGWKEKIKQLRKLFKRKIFPRYK